MTRPTRPGVLRAVATAVIIVAAAVLWHRLPTPDDVYGPFDVRAGVGQAVSGRAITARVDGVRIAPRIRKDRETSPVLDAVGIWIVIDGEAMTTRTDQNLSSELIVGPNTYKFTGRLDFMPLAGSLTPGISVHSSWVFDVPADLVAAGAQTITLRLWVGDGRMDSRLVIDMPLDDPRVDRTDFVRLAPTVQVGT
ncbi:hypothetical protein A7U43_14455 [Mycobacterium adipatum]|uniref:DUF4352 domain-containing protein n=1 Tax=Mycobacterium adipatum TaxID=1682113 RepID=A0A172UM69_9MYCO|nr:hypothetical protein [Mycobacterium adipatum]ANE80349.1 hypothetical protein A7U43_14455 [Mycobacterium adipatum]